MLSLSFLPAVGSSLSARRAWIEMETMLPSWTRYAVALRKESVDRNPVGVDAGYIARPSLSARRAWIEINVGFPIAAFLLMSLSARRAWIEIVVDGHRVHITRSRSPQGERG